MGGRRRREEPEEELGGADRAWSCDDDVSFPSLLSLVWWTESLSVTEQGRRSSFLAIRMNGSLGYQQGCCGSACALIIIIIIKRN